MTTWREEITMAMNDRFDSWDNVEGVAHVWGALDEEFDSSYGTSNGRPFTVWTFGYVYFPVVYDGAEWVGSVPRNPCDEPTRHLGRE